VNKTQIQTLIAPLVGIAAAWLASKIPFIDQATWSIWINGAISAGVLAFMGWITGNTSIISQAAALPEVQSVKLEPSAPAAVVAATPSNVTK
jgi:hypothetical protein